MSCRQVARAALEFSARATIADAADACVAAMLRTVDSTVREEHISMTMTTRILILTALTAAAGSEARAQVPAAPPSMGFVNVNVGAQAASRSIDVNNAFSLYGETATVTTSQKIGSGALFDISGGYRVWRNVTAAIGFSNFSRSSDVTGTASIPDPLVTNRPAIVTISQPGLSHSERAVHLQALWLFPVTNEFDVTLALGPSIFSVKQEINSVTVPPGTQTVAPSVGSESKTALGANIQVDGNYMVTPRLGAGVFIRYARTTVDLPSVADVRAGGFHIGGGVRIRF
jgi:hypothetical protein